MSTAEWPVNFPARRSAITLFSYEVRGPWRIGAFTLAILLQSGVVFLVAVISLTTSVVFTTPHYYNTTTLIAPPAEHVPEQAAPTAPTPVSKLEVKTQNEPAPPVLEVHDLPKPPVLEHVVTVPTAKPPVHPPASAPVAFDTPPPGPAVTTRPERHVQTTVFGSSAEPTLPARSVASVQTGGFGDPSGIAASTHSTTRTTIAASGAFDLPPGPGSGNGAGGAHGSRGTVASAGFGNGIATTTPGSSRGRLGSVEQTQFSPAPVATTPARNRATEQVHVTPVAIQSKPSPVYTEEARQLRIEGEVIVDVVFTATGEMRIVSVLKGLGHGLDEAAVTAARKIRFTPAQQDGQKVDYPATLHIVFALS